MSKDIKVKAMPIRRGDLAPFLGVFGVQAANAPVEIPNGYNVENVIAYQAKVPTDVGASDTITVTLPARWQNTGFTILAVRAEKWTTGSSPVTAPGSRSKTDIGVAVASYVESTGVVTLAKTGSTTVTSASESCDVFLVVAPSNNG